MSVQPERERTAETAPRGAEPGASRGPAKRATPSAIPPGAQPPEWDAATAVPVPVEGVDGVQGRGPSAGRWGELPVAPAETRRSPALVEGEEHPAPGSHSVAWTLRAEPDGIMLGIRTLEEPHWSRRCASPCTLRIPTGRYAVRTEGTEDQAPAARDFTLRKTGDTTLRPPNRSARALGLGLLGVGVVATLGGITLAFLTARSCDNLACGTAWTALGTTAVGVSSVMLGVGLYVQHGRLRFRPTAPHVARQLVPPPAP